MSPANIYTTAAHDLGITHAGQTIIIEMMDGRLLYGYFGNNLSAVSERNNKWKFYSIDDAREIEVPGEEILSISLVEGNQRVYYKSDIQTIDLRSSSSFGQKVNDGSLHVAPPSKDFVVN